MPNNKIIDLDRLSRFKDKLDNELDKKANVDGNYPTMTVGSADNLTPYGENSGVEESIPFVFQSAGGSSDIGSQAQLKALRGNSVAFNNVIRDGNFPDVSEYYAINGTISVSNNVLSYTIATIGGDLASNRINQDFSSFANHKYLVKVKVKAPYNTTVRTYVGSFNVLGTAVANTWTELSLIISTTNALGNNNLYFDVYGQSSYQVGDIIQVKEYQKFDLTLMFGAGNEPTSVLEFNRLFPKPYYEYNAGTLLSSKSNGYKTVGYNAFDGELEQGAINNSTGVKETSSGAIRTKNYIKVISGQTYTLEQDNFVKETNYTGRILYKYDSSYNYLGFVNMYNTNTATLDNNCYYVLFAYSKSGITVPTNPQIAFHLTWDGSRTGYEPYESETYPLPNIELRSAGSVYDELKSDGTLIRRIGSYTFTGNETWTELSLNRYQCTILNGLAKGYEGDVIAQFTANIKYTHVSRNQNASIDNSICIGGAGSITIRDTTATNMASYMAGKTIYFELATPTEEQNDNYTYAETTPIDDYGTQEFLSSDSIVIPQGNEFFYPVDYKAFIDSLGGRNDIEYDASEVVSHSELNTKLEDYEKTIDIKKFTLKQILSATKSIVQSSIDTVDLSTLVWTHQSLGTYGYWRSSSINTLIKPVASGNDKANVVAENYIVASANSISGNQNNVIAITTSGYIYITNNSTTTSPTGVLAYEKA